METRRVSPMRPLDALKSAYRLYCLAGSVSPLPIAMPTRLMAASAPRPRLWARMAALTAGT
jgi:hypothetical protein